MKKRLLLLAMLAHTLGSTVSAQQNAYVAATENAYVKARGAGQKVFGKTVLIW